MARALSVPRRHICRRQALRNSMLRTYVEFRSDNFPPYEGEEEQVNPNLWGKRLAEFLGDKLRSEGFDCEEPFSEDWGWVLPVTNDGFSLWIACSRYREYPDGYLCHIEPHKPFVRRFLKRVDTRDRVASLQRAMGKVLSDSSASVQNAGGRTRNLTTQLDKTPPSF